MRMHCKKEKKKMFKNIYPSWLPHLIVFSIKYVFTGAYVGRPTIYYLMRNVCRKREVKKKRKKKLLATLNTGKLCVDTDVP